MANSKTDLILHPTRVRIMQTLRTQELTTKQLAEQLDDIPASSIYRHLRRLLEANTVEVVETNRVRGVDEKVYRLASVSRLPIEVLRQFEQDDWIQHFTAAMAILSQEMNDYLRQESDNDRIMTNVAFARARIVASEAEWAEIRAAFGRILQPYLDLQPDADRQARTLAIITHPSQQ